MSSTKNALTYVKEYFEEKAGESIPDEELYDYLLESRKVHSEVTGTGRLWNDIFVVVEIDEKLIGFYDAYTTSDNYQRLSAIDSGWEFDQESICYVEARTTTVTEYVPIQEDK